MFYSWSDEIKESPRLVASRNPALVTMISNLYTNMVIMAVVSDTLQIGFIKTYNCCYVICAM